MYGWYMAPKTVLGVYMSSGGVRDLAQADSQLLVAWSSGSCGSGWLANLHTLISQLNRILSIVNFHFVLFAVETYIYISGVLSQTALDLMCELGQHLHQMTGKSRSKEYLLQRLFIAIQNGNAAAVLGTARRGQAGSLPGRTTTCVYACAWLMCMRVTEQYS